MPEISVSIPLHREDWAEIESLLRENFQPVGDTGIGLGYRDLNFPVKDRQAGRRLKRKIWNLLTKAEIPVGDTTPFAHDRKTVIVAF